MNSLRKSVNSCKRSAIRQRGRGVLHLTQQLKISWRFRVKRTVRVVVLLSLACAALATFSNFAQAQKIDIAFGISTTEAPGASSADSNHNPISLTGGVYPGFSGDFLFYHNVGIGAEVFWRGGHVNCPDVVCGLDSGINFRPVFYDFNAVYSPKLASHVHAELVGGIGAMDTHYSACTLSGNSCGGTQLISSSNHFDVDLGGGLKFYLTKGFFVRPEARYYWINNNTDYSSNHATRFGASIGYTFR